ncbi:MAG: ketosteroid isomerase-like protein [Patiriisocius sp.]|jgi:ketosteroid isomerase-like protein
MAPALLQLDEEYSSVRRAILQALAAIRSDYFDDYFDCFTDDAVWMMPSKSHDVHIEEAKKFYGFTKNFRFDQETTIDELVVEKDLAMVRVSFDGYLRSKRDDTATPLKSVSRHLWVMRRCTDGEWRISRDIWNNPKT